MPPYLMLFVFIAGIIGLFWFDREAEPRTSKALWVPVAWLFINCSRPVSQWLGVFGIGGSVNMMESYTEGSPTDRNVFLILLISGIVILAIRRRRLSPILGNMGAIALFYSYCAISILWSEDPFVAFKHWFKGIGDIVMVLIILTDEDPSGALKQVFKRIGYVLIPLSVLLLKYFPELGRVYTTGGASEYTGVTTQKNSLGADCLIFGLAALWRFLIVYRDKLFIRRKYILTVQVAMLVMAIWLLRTSDSMTSLVCFLMGGFLIVLGRRRIATQLPILIHAAVITMVSLATFAIFVDKSMLQGVGRDSTLTGRTEIWNMVLSQVKHPLIGAGYESFWVGDRLETLWHLQDGLLRGINQAHNGYIELYLNLGWIGIALLAVLLLVAYRRAIITFSKDVDAGSLALAFFVSEVTYSLTEAGFRMMNPLWIFFLLTLIGMPKTSPPEELVASDSRPANEHFRRKSAPQRQLSTRTVRN